MLRSAPSRRRWAWRTRTIAFLAVYECIYGGNPPRRPNRPRDASDEAVKAFDALFAPAEPARMETAKERAAREAVLPPHVGRISVRKFAMFHFKADMFGLDSTECTLMRWHVKRAEERSATYAVVLVDWHGAAHEFQLHRASGELYRLLVDAWELTRSSRTSAAPARRAEPAKTDPNDPNSKLGRLNAEARNRARAKLERAGGRRGRRGARSRARYEWSALERVPPRARRVSRAFAISLPGNRRRRRTSHGGRTFECQDERVHVLKNRRRGGAARDGRGGVSDPFARRGGGSLECTTEVVYETVNPEWDETFVFNLGTSTSDDRDRGG